MPEHIRQVPSLPGLPLLGHALRLKRNVLGLLDEGARECGDLARYQIGTRSILVPSSPHLIQSVLQKQQDDFIRDTHSSREIARICGQSLLTTHGEEWRYLRRMIQPSLSRPNMQALYPDVASTILDSVAHWHKNADTGAPQELLHTMTHLSYLVIARSLFGTLAFEELDTVERASAVMLKETYRRIESILKLPDWMTPIRRIRFGRARQEFSRIALSQIEQHRAATVPPDILRAMMHRGENDEEQLPEETLTAQLITLMLGGHETTANTLAWAVYLLLTNPASMAALEAEVATLPSDRVPDYDELMTLPYLRAVLQETMRLYPAIWILERRASRDTVLGNYAVPENTSIMVCPWLMHRHPAHWEEPEQFNPDRFLSGNTPDPFVYMPFGAGPHKCIGLDFAMMEMTMVLAFIVRTYRLTLKTEGPVAPAAGISLKPARDILLQIEPRA